MGVEVNVLDLTYGAYMNLQSSQYCFAKFSGVASVVGKCDVSGEAMCGILQNNPKSGENAVVRVMGKSKLKAAGAVTVGALVTTNHSSMALAATMGSGDYTICQGCEALAENGTYEVIVRAVPVRAK